MSWPACVTSLLSRKNTPSVLPELRSGLTVLTNCHNEPAWPESSMELRRLIFCRNELMPNWAISPRAASCCSGCGREMKSANSWSETSPVRTV